MFCEELTSIEKEMCESFSENVHPSVRISRKLFTDVIFCIFVVNVRQMLVKDSFFVVTIQEYFVDTDMC